MILCLKISLEYDNDVTYVVYDFVTQCTTINLIKTLEFENSEFELAFFRNSSMN
jgi:hypothetical protein